MITSIKIFKENLFVPHNIEGRQDKLNQDALKIFQQETIEGDIVIDYTIILKSDLIKTKLINGNVFIDVKQIPNWLQYIKVNGSVFIHQTSHLDSLVGCPYWVEKSFTCNYTNITNLIGAPEYVGDNFDVGLNDLDSLQGCPKYVGGDFIIIDNYQDFNEQDIRRLCDVQGNVQV